MSLYDENGNSINETYEHDYDGDGVVDEIMSYTYNYSEDGSVLESVDVDWDGDGVADEVYSNYVSETDSEGNVVYEEYVTMT